MWFRFLPKRVLGKDQEAGVQPLFLSVLTGIEQRISNNGYRTTACAHVILSEAKDLQKTEPGGSGAKQFEE
jgi:hypothetical protein